MIRNCEQCGSRQERRRHRWWCQCCSRLICWRCREVHCLRIPAGVPSDTEQGDIRNTTP